MLLEPGGTIDFNGGRITYPDIRMVFWAGGNPFHHHQDLNRFGRAWQKPETIVVNEIWWTAAARRADIVLPATTSYERNDIGGSSRDRFLFATPKLIPPVGMARNDHDMLAEIAERIGQRTAYTEDRTEAEWIRHLYERMRAGAQAQGVGMPDFAAFREQGWWEAPEPVEEQVLHADFRRDPERNRLQTPSGRIEIFSEKIAGFGYDDCPPHPSWLEPAEWLGGAAAKRWPLHMVSSQPRDKLHSQLDGGPVSRAGKIAGREPLWINPADAAARGVADGAVVRVFNDRGACLAGAVVTDAVRPGVIVLQTGSWFDPPAPSSSGPERLAQAVSAMTARVEVEAFTGEIPAVAAFDLPEIAVA
jgi:biotin/methionine sulfoxide reductase